MKTILVIGASGFVGSAVCNAAIARGYTVLKAPPLRISPTGHLISGEESVSLFRSQVTRADCVINAAGLPEATASGTELVAANAVLPAYLARECNSASTRFVHISSAAVQGRTKTLNADSRTDAFSPYSESKAAGEKSVLRYCNAIVYRPPGVHGPNRRVTRRITKLAVSWASTVAGDGKQNTPQALIENVADAAVFIATIDKAPPPIVSHPSEGISTSELLIALGNREPAHLPTPLARLAIAVAFSIGRLVPPVSGHARRIELLWFGQNQARSWLEANGWQPPISKDGWHRLGCEIRSGS